MCPPLAAQKKKCKALNVLMSHWLVGIRQEPFAVRVKASHDLFQDCAFVAHWQMVASLLLFSMTFFSVEKCSRYSNNNWCESNEFRRQEERRKKKEMIHTNDTSEPDAERIDTLKISNLFIGTPFAADTHNKCIYLFCAYANFHCGVSLIFRRTSNACPVYPNDEKQ